MALFQSQSAFEKFRIYISLQYRSSSAQKPHRSIFQGLLHPILASTVSPCYQLHILTETCNTQLPRIQAGFRDS